jgi:hypothetical protein
MFVEGKHEILADFYHGVNRFAHKDGYYEPEYDGVDTLMLYTLTPGVTSGFRNIMICGEFCGDVDEVEVYK